jgi:hypothetical protein
LKVALFAIDHKRRRSSVAEQTFGLEDSVIRPEIRSGAEPNRAFLSSICTLHANEIPRTDPLVQVDHVRVVDLDIAASKSDNLRDQSGQHFGARR